MPEGHTVHRLATAFRAAFVGQRVRALSPQGRFAFEAEEIDAQRMVSAEAVGKHLFLGFAPAEIDPAEVDPSAGIGVRYVHVHLGLYGSWTFAGDEQFEVAPAIGAPRRRVGEVEEILDPDLSVRSGQADWRRIVPRDTVRLRLQGAHGLADLTGPTACELIGAEQRAEIMARLGPDPLRADADGGEFVRRVLRSRSPIGVQLMNQQVIAGIGNIYRAEALFRARLDPFVAGSSLTRGMVEGIWEDLVPLMEYGARTGRIVTTEPDHRDIEARLIERSRGSRQNGDEEAGVVPREKSFYVYHRQTLPCRVCGTRVRSAQMAARTVFWCPQCQTERSRRSPWSRQNPAAAWALES
ncbi:MAG: zinc finger domain-containing protein [Brachybacterium sp.]|nr:zinc finger domain-containing protein [Brachybacterium sp.]